jgi:hypothetical protein
VSKQNVPVVPDRITPQDLEDKFQALQDEIQGKVEEKKPAIAAVAAGGGIVLLIIFFLLGRRSGRKRSAVVEIRRI